MEEDYIYSKKEIGQILKKASQIQTQKELYGAKEGLSNQELIQLAAEVGIDQESLLEALASNDVEQIENTFEWVQGTAKVQTIELVPGEVTEENWDEIIRTIRKVIGGIGKDSKNRASFEWEQRLKEIGYRHISLTPQNGKTNIQYVYNWKGIQFMSNIFGFMIPAMFTAGSFGSSGLPLIAYIVIAGVAGLAGVFGTRLFLKPYFEKQKTMMEQLFVALRKTLKPANNNQISLENSEVYSTSTPSESPKKILKTGL